MLGSAYAGVTGADKIWPWPPRKRGRGSEFKSGVQSIVEISSALRILVPKLGIDFEYETADDIG